MGKRSYSVLALVQNTFYMYVGFGGDNTRNVISALRASVTTVEYQQLPRICPILFRKEEGGLANTDI